MPEVREPSGVSPFIPLVLGVSGHRNPRPADVAALKRQVRKVIHRFHAEYPTSPLIFLSPLAEGGDRIAAEAALELGAQHKMDIRLVVPLPMPVEVYERTFPGTVEDFRGLLAQASMNFTLPMVVENTGRSLEEPGARDLQYEAVGQYIARHCQVLIALWDGEETHKVGGTSQIVRYKLQGLERLVSYENSKNGGPRYESYGRSLLSPEECGPVVHVRTPREGSAAADVQDNEQPKRMYPAAFPHERQAHQYYDALFRRIENFNRDLKKRKLHEQSGCAGKLAPAAEMDHLEWSAKYPEPFYEVATSMASTAREETISAMTRIHVCIFAAVVCFDTAAHLALPEPYQAIRALFLIGAILFTLEAIRRDAMVKKKRSQDMYQDYRALAEGLRIQMFWNVGGLDESVADYYLGKYRTELDWIRNALRNWNLSAGRRPASAPDLQLVLERWVKHQSAYFAKRSDEHRLKRLEERVRWLVLAAFGVGGLLLAADAVEAVMRPFAERLAGHPLLVHGVGWMNREWPTRGVLLILIATLLVAAGMVKHYSESMAYAEHVKQSVRMHSLYRWAQSLVEEAIEEGRTERAQAVLRDLGIAALEENSEWVFLHRERPVEVPHGG